MKELPKLLCLMGPTGSGKTDLAVELVERFPFEIISVDSAMVYKELNIGTAKPEATVLQKAPHRLIDIIEPEDVYSAASFRTDALREITSITEAGKMPLLVGGTGLYFRALLEGISELPSADHAIRQQLEVQAETQGWQYMHEQLDNIDPVAAARIHPNDPQRIQRALEIYKITGKPMTTWLAENKPEPLPFAIIRVILEPQDRKWLHDRLHQRFQQMIEQGLIGELEYLLEHYDLTEQSSSMRLVGYRQVLQFLHGQFDQETLVEKGTAATRQLAKRQLTWLRSETQARRLKIDVSSPLNDLLQIVNNTSMFSS